MEKDDLKRLPLIHLVLDDVDKAGWQRHTLSLAMKHRKKLDRMVKMHSIADFGHEGEELESTGKASTETLQIVTQLHAANANFTSSKNFEKYKKELRTVFGVKDTPINEKAKLFFAGFLEGEGSMNVSAKKAAGAQFGVALDPEFSVTQHINGIKQLYLGLQIFNTGRISFKADSSAVFVLKIDNRKSLEEKVIPFYNTYVAPYTSPTKLQRLKTFTTILEKFNKDVHTDLNSFADTMLPLWDSMRIQRGQKNLFSCAKTFASLQEAQEYVRNPSNHKVYKRGPYTQKGSAQPKQG